MKEFSELTDIVTQNFKWHKARKDTLILLLCAILVRQTANLSKLAEYFPDAKAVKDSSYQQIYRFFREVEFNYCLIAQVIMGWLKLTKVKLTLDRTHWQFGKKHINILMLAIVYKYKHVAIPIFWKLLNNGKGNSKKDDRIELIELFKTTFPDIQIIGLLADREFVGKEWFKWLNQNQLAFCIPIRKNNVVRRKGRKDTMPVERLFGDVQRKGKEKACLAFSFFRVGLSYLAKACMKILSSFQFAFEPMAFIHLLS